MKRLFAACLALAALAPACQPGSKSAPPTSKVVKVGFLVKQPEEPWFQLEWKFADKAAADLGFEVIKIGATDGEKVLAAIDSLAAAGAQGFVICTPDAQLGPAIAAKARARSLKLMTVDDQFIGSDGHPMADVHHLGISARKIGESVGASLYAELRQRGWTPAETGLAAVTFEELATAKERTDGAIDALVAAGFPQDHVYKAPQRTSDVPGAFDAVNILATQKPQVKRWLVCGMNDSAVLGAVRALEGRGFGADTVIGMGINGTDCIPELEKAKPTGFYGSILLTPKRHGYETAALLYKWIHDGVEPPLDTRTTGLLMTRDNFRQLLREQGIRE